MNVHERNIKCKKDRYVIAMIKTNMDEGTITATVAGMQCDFLVDSGAQVNTLMEKLYVTMKNDDRYSHSMYNIREGSDIALKAYASKAELEVRATFETFLFISEDRPVYLEKFYVFKDANRSLLGRSTAIRYSVLMVGLEVPVLRREYCNNFVQNGAISSIEVSKPFPKFNIPPVNISYDTSRTPCRNIFSNIPEAIRPLVEKRLQELVETDIIELVCDNMDMSFCSPMLAIPKGKQDIRLVIDLRGPNQYVQRIPFAMPTLESILAKLNGASWFSTGKRYL